MQITSRRKTAATFIVLGACSVGLALALNITWVIRWREVGMAVLGFLFFGFIIAGVTLNTIFLVREIRRNEQHDSFINSVTHELKTPIASIRLYLETLQSRNLDEAQRTNFYRIMLEDTDRLLGTVEQVLHAGKISHKPGRRNWKQFDLGEVARESVELARTRHHLDAEAIEFHDYAVGSEENCVNGEAEELSAAISNVLDNAVKYSINPVRIRVEVLAEGANVLVRVKDHGVGIPRQELKRIFRRFYRVPQRIKARVKGTGLGLFIVRSVARYHGGDAYASSEGEGLGATVTIKIPRIYNR